MQFPLEWGFIQTSLSSAPFGHVIPSLFVSQKNSLNIYIALRRGSTSGFLSSSLYLCCPKFSMPGPLLLAPPPLSDILFPSLFFAGVSTQAGGGGSTHPFLPVSSAPQTLSGLMFPRIPETWCCKSGGRPGLYCGSDTRCPPQIDSVL